MLSNQNPDTWLTQIKSQSSQYQQIAGHFKLRATGIKKFLGSVELDIIAKEPHYLYLSIDSFFKQPARIVTYDGQNLYGLPEEKLEDIFELPIGPKELIDVLLRRISVTPQEIQRLFIKEDALCVSYRSGIHLKLWTDQAGKIQKRELRDSSDKLIYTVIYDNYPQRFALEANYKDQKHGMTLTGQDVKLNQGVFDEQLFRR